MARVSEEACDVVILGARVAGAATALLLSRAGRRVVVLERSEAGADTLSTHALTRGGVSLLGQWGVLDELTDRGTPPVRRTTFHYGDQTVALDIESRDGVDWLLAPRRTVLDPVLVEAARSAGAEVRHECRVTGLLGDGQAVRGVVYTDRAGHEHSVRARLTVGADGARSLVARQVGARTIWQGAHAGAMLYGHFPDPGADGYHWFYDIGATAGIIPTNAGKVCAWVGTSADRFMAELRGDPEAAFVQLLGEAAPAFAEAFPPDSVETRLHGYPGRPSYLRQASGPGWALVGDAGYFKDPLTAHGITDALRDAGFLASVVLASDSIGADPIDATGYGELRDPASMAFARVTDRIASYGWDIDGIKSLVRAEGRLLAQEATALAASDTSRRTADRS